MTAAKKAASPKKTKAPKRRKTRIGDRQIETLGQKDEFWSDLYHRAMTTTLANFTLGAFALFMFNNLFFATLFDFVPDAVANVPAPNLLYLFFFSIENFTTVGFGDMHPQSIYGHTVASIEGFVALIQTAGLTGLIFARFSRPRARVMFSANPVIARHEGVPTLMIRLANERNNAISDANAVLWIVRLEPSLEGQRFRRFHRLALTRHENPTFVLSWTLFHPINENSLLFGKTAEDLNLEEFQFVITVKGVDDTSLQELRARKTYRAADILWGQRYADIIENLPGGGVLLDYNKFDQTRPE